MAPGMEEEDAAVAEGAERRGGNGSKKQPETRGIWRSS